MFSIDIYESMLDNDETWFSLDNGNAMLVNDCSLLNC